MPASLTRPCRTCKVEKPTPSAFRDEGVRGAGRPPTNCRTCRRGDETLRARHQRNIDQREAQREKIAGRRRRSRGVIAATRGRLHPDGHKVCPANSGCGQRLPLTEYGTNRNLPDGLQNLCRPCVAEHSAKRLAV